MSLTLILGGIRSGKSSYAVQTVTKSGRSDVTFIATAPHIDGDADLEERISRHRRERPANWQIIEEPLDLVTAVNAAGGHVIIIDCVTLWINNLIWRGDTDEAIEATAATTLDVIASRRTPTLVITNEVGMGVHPESAIGRRFSEVLGRVNQRWMAAADRRLLMVAGQAVTLAEAPTDL